MSSRYPFAVIKEKLHARQGEVADFAIGARKVELPEELQDWIKGNHELITRPASPNDVAEFRNAAIEMLVDVYGFAPDADCIVPVPGGRVGMSAFIACAVKPGDDVVATEPGYPAFSRMAAHRHADVHDVPLDPALQFAPDFSVLPGSVQVRVVALNYPNNPTGATLTPSTRETLTQFASRADAMLFNDAVYGPLTYDKQPATLLNPDGGSNDVQVVELHSLTKLYPLGPLSGSFLAGSREIMNKISTYSEFAWAPMSALQIRSTTHCMQDRRGRSEKKSFFSGQLQKLRAALLAIGFEPYPTPAGIYVLCRVPTAIGGECIGSAQQAAAALMDRFDIAVVPFETGKDNYIRFSSMYRDEDLVALQATAERLSLDNQ